MFLVKEGHVNLRVRGRVVYRVGKKMSKGIYLLLSMARQIPATMDHTHLPYVLCCSCGNFRTTFEDMRGAKRPSKKCMSSSASRLQLWR